MWQFMVVVCLILQSANTDELIRKRHLNPQEFMTISQIIEYWGYPSEEYEILTADGYYLQATEFSVQSRKDRSTMWLFMVVACLILQSANAEELIRKRHLNPQGFMNISEIIDYWGYSSEEYEILTADGYYLLANRIPYGVHSPGKKGNRPVVLLVHPTLAEGRSWIANLPSNSLGFFLADAGYDVWLLNYRGTTWSRRHEYLSIDEEEFWNFSFHEMGIYDVPATIEFILHKTKQDALYYVGHSLGSIIGYVAFSVIPELAQKVKLFMSFAPDYTLLGIRGPLKPLLVLPEKILTAIWGKKEFCLFSNRMKAINAKICSFPGLDQLCFQSIFLSVGFNKNLNVSRVDVYAGICPDFTSVKTGVHLNQIYKAQRFQYFDYRRRNKEIYNTTTPPLYKIEDMLVPTAVWYGGKDIVSTKKAVELLLPRIPRLVFKKYIPSWNHVDFFWGLDAPERLYPDMLCLMQQHQ